MEVPFADLRLRYWNLIYDRILYTPKKLERTTVTILYSSITVKDKALTDLC